MRRLRIVFRKWRRPVGVFIALIIMALLCSIRYVNIKKTCEDIFKSLQWENSLKVQSPLKSTTIEKSSSFGLLFTNTVLPIEDNLQTPEDFGDGKSIDLHQHERSQDEITVVRRLRKRREKVLEVCRSGNFQHCHMKRPINDATYFFHHYKTSVCTVAKAGSTTWREHIRNVNGGPPRTENIRNDKILKAILRRPLKDMVKYVTSSSKIITVRHPLTRLVSAFRDVYRNGIMAPHYPSAEAEIRKIEHRTLWPERFHKFWLPALFALNMVPPNTHLEVNIKTPIDPSVLYSTEEYERLYLVLQPSLTFEQFLKFVLKTYEEGNPDSHWSPYHQWCCPCHFDYDYITKVETLSEDLEYVFKKLGIPADHHTAIKRIMKNEDSSNLYLQYFTRVFQILRLIADPKVGISMILYYQNISTTLRGEIYKYLKPDMDLFGYELPENFLN
ncbi:carbohydrate sulfotransferase 9-like [Palaemon carinicauda]|uniref:carbohydrate sulfotransferase 9-like n=1 Tax=Palaemon carinicauda TaxID=392227 RepID=UPI0035B58B54